MTMGLGFVGPRLPIVMGVFYIFIGPIVAIGKTAGLAAAMTALIIGGLLQFAWSPLIGRARRFFPAIVTGTTILLIGTGLMKIGINVATGLNTPAFGKPLTLAAVGVDIIGRNMKNRRDALIVACALGVGLGIQVAPPHAFDVIIPEVCLLSSDGIVMGILTAMVLNIVLPKEPGKG